MEVLQVWKVCGITVGNWMQKGDEGADNSVGDCCYFSGLLECACAHASPDLSQQKTNVGLNYLLHKFKGIRTYLG